MVGYRVTVVGPAILVAKAAAVVQAAVDHTEQVVAVRDIVIVVAGRRCSCLKKTTPSYLRAACCG